MAIFIAHIEQGKALLTPEESWHCAKVLRKKAGDEVELIDGHGAFYKGKLLTIHEKATVAEVTEGPIHSEQRHYTLHLAIAPTKNIDRIEWMLEKAVEIGVDEATFIKCKNSERVAIKHERMVKIAESAVKQSKQALIPKIHDLVKFDNVLKLPADMKLIAFCSDEFPKTSLKDLEFKGKSVLVLIGPEGDFSPEEINHAHENGFVPVSLGNTRLRTETAGLYVVQALSILT